MYVIHKPGDHGVSQKRKDKYKAHRNKRDREGTSEEMPPAAKNPTPSKTGKKKKCVLSERLRAALVIQASLTENQFDHIWEEVNKEGENYTGPTLGRRLTG
jgi:hypothetical protein